MTIKESNTISEATFQSSLNSFKVDCPKLKSKKKVSVKYLRFSVLSHVIEMYFEYAYVKEGNEGYGR